MQALQFHQHRVQVQAVAFHFDHRGHARQLQRDTEPLGPAGQRRGRAVGTDQAQRDFFAQARVAGQQAQQPGLFQHRLGGHAHQFGLLPDPLRVAGQPDAADDAALGDQRQVDARAHRIQLLRQRSVDLHPALPGQHQQCTFVQLADPRRLAAGDDDAGVVHHIDVAVDDGHRAVDDGLRQGAVEREHGQGSVAAIRGGHGGMFAARVFGRCVTGGVAADARDRCEEC